MESEVQERYADKESPLQLTKSKAQATKIDGLARTTPRKITCQLGSLKDAVFQTKKECNFSISY